MKDMMQHLIPYDREERRLLVASIVVASIPVLYIAIGLLIQNGII